MLRNQAVALILLALVGSTTADMPSYRELARDGVISGFGNQSGDPARMINRIPAIDRPRYIPVDEARMRDDDLCVGIERQGVMHFAPLYILNRHEIVNHKDAPAIAHCPLAGLTVSIDGRMVISGLLRWDTFVLYDPESEQLILPYDQRSLDGEQHVPLRPLEMLTFAGVREKFPDAMILSPRAHEGSRTTYGSYPTDEQLGIGHPKPGMRGQYRRGKEPFHPKEYVLIVGTPSRMLKAYPFAALDRASDGGAKVVTDRIGDLQVTLSFDPEARHAQVVSASSEHVQARAFSYYFAMRQHLPDLPVFTAE